MNLYDVFLKGENKRAAAAGRFFGLYVGVVTENKDSLGRVKLRFPWLSDSAGSHWARIAVPMGGGGKGGMYFLPDINDEVLVAFEHGDPRFPYVLGALWNGKDLPPASNVDGKNNVRLIKSRRGHVIQLNDDPGTESIEIADASGKNRIVIDIANNRITIAADQDITLAAPRGTIRLKANKIELKSAGTEIAAGEDGLKLVSDRGNVRIKGNHVEIN